MSPPPPPPPPPRQMPPPPLIKKSGGGNTTDYHDNIVVQQQFSMARINLANQPKQQQQQQQQYHETTMTVSHPPSGGDGDDTVNGRKRMVLNHHHQPPPTMMTMNRIANHHHHQQHQQHQQCAPLPPPPPPPVPQNQRMGPPPPLQQHSNHIHYFAAPINQFNQHHHQGITSTTAATTTTTRACNDSAMISSSQQQQVHGVRTTLQSQPYLPPAAMIMSNQYNRQPPPPPFQQQQQFATNAMTLPSPSPPPPPQPFHQNQQPPPPPSLLSSSIRPSQPQYNNNNNDNLIPNNNHLQQQQLSSPPHIIPKIDPAQIPRIPLFTRPHHAPATIYPTCCYNNNNSTTNYNNNSSSTTTTMQPPPPPPPPPPLDSRYVFNNQYNNIHNNIRRSSSSSFTNASPRLLSSTVHTFPYDTKTLRACGDIPLGLIVTPLGCLSSLCCTCTVSNTTTTTANAIDAMRRTTVTTTTTTTISSSMQWNGREQGDIYSDNKTDIYNSKDVDYVIYPFDGYGGSSGGGSSSSSSRVMMRGNTTSLTTTTSTTTTTNNNNNNNREGSSNYDDDDDDPERIPVIRGPKRSIVVNADEKHSSSKTTTTSSSSSSRAKTVHTITPPRCNRCNAYLNPYCTPSPPSSSSSSSFTTSSRLTNTFQGLIYTPTQSYNCNMCGSKSSIIISNEEYIANNIFESTSLSYGTVEYEVGNEYEVRKKAVENVFLYAVEYAEDDDVVVVPMMDVGGSSGSESVKNQYQHNDHHHQHHGTMKSHGWKESLDAIKNVARELCITAPRREEEDGVVCREVKIGIFAFCQDMLVFPYIKRKEQHFVENGEEEEEEEELAVAIVSDVTDDPFCPLPLKLISYNVGEGLDSKEWHRFCRVLDSFTELMGQLVGEYPPQQQQDDKWRRNCGGAALVVLGDALKDSGGRGTLITSRRPNYGVGALRDREAVSNYGIGSSSEQKLFTPLQQLVLRNNDSVGIVKDKPAGLFYKKLGEDCAKNRVCLDIVVTSSSVSVPSTDPKQLQQNPNMREFLDVATLGELCRVTCGHFKWLRVGNECGVAVNGDSDSFTGEQLREELKRSALAYTGSDVVFKLRCSSGVQVKSYSPTLPIGNLIGDGIVNSAELELSSMHPGTSIAVVLEHKIGGVVDTMRGGSSRKGIDMPMVFFQSAVLYTTKTGFRRVRVSTLGLPTSKVPADIFRSADLGAVSTMLTRGAISDVERDGGSLRLARENVFNKCVSILANYRSRTTARTSPSGQLILPESLQLLPLFCLSLRKSRMLRHSLPKGMSSAKPFPTADERAYHIFYGRMVSPNMSLQCVHPHLFQVSDMRTRDGDWITPPILQENKFDETNVIAASMRPVCQLPKTMNPSIACLDESGMYLLDDRFSFYLFVGKDVPDEKWRDLLSVGGVGSSRARGSNIPIGGLSLADTDSAHKLRSIIHQLRLLNSPNETLGLTARHTYAPLILVFVGRGSVFEEEMDSLLVDDPDTHERSYVDFLCDIHRSVREKWDQT